MIVARKHRRPDTIGRRLGKPKPYKVAGTSCGDGCGITDAMLAGILQIGCLQNESMWFERCLQIESTASEEVQGKHRFPWPTALY